jgi:hypothetical protein
MNERIKELFTLAFPPSLNDSNLVQLSAEKFAELIVRECIERVRSQYIPTRDQTVEGKLNPFHPQLRLRTDHENGMVECGVNSVIALEELIQEQTDKWYKENILGNEE